MTEQMKDTTLVIGLGNPILGDDGVGWRVAEGVRKRIDEPEGLDREGRRPYDVEVDCLAVGGLRLMERVLGYRRVVLVDAMEPVGESKGGAVRGRVLESDLAELSRTGSGHSTSVHDTTLADALAMASLAGGPVPESVRVVGIEAGPVYEFSEILSPEVSAAVPDAVERVLHILENDRQSAREGGNDG